ncbi:MAG: PQQ-dependent sugar dehydrogenase, partial [Myxococcales bacterium]|nr:PQQ-dependent sugar dehydrogenase [Myxococcales bacterium]
ARVGPPQPLHLRFVPIANDAGALRITDLAFLPDARDEFVVLDKDGEVIHLRLEGDTARRLGGFHLDGVWFDSDAGLISVAFDPDFARNRFFYLGFTISIETSVIRRYHWDANDYAGIPRSEVEVLAVTGRRAPRSWHNVGSMGFTADGDLWALFGDKVLDEVAQDVASPLGALLRVRPNLGPEGGYTVPDDNPYADGSGHPAVYAKGMRSPWKGFYHEGRWWFGDVGLDTHEEVNRIDEPGQNFGWPDIEGPCPGGECGATTGPWSWFGRGQHPFVLDDPEATSSRLRAVWVAGPRRADGAPDRYAGRWDDVMIFGDAFTGFVRGKPLDGQQPSFPVGHLHFATAFAQGPDGYVYATALGTWPPDAPVAPSPLLRAVLAD